MNPTLSFLRWPALLAALAVVYLGASPLARANDLDEIRQIRTEMQQLAQRLNALEQKVAQGQPGAAAAGSAAAPISASAPVEATPATASAPKITIDNTGFTFASADSANFIKLHGLVQLDSRWYTDDHGIPNNDTFVLRRARLIFEGGFDKIYSFLIVPEFGGGGTGVSNAPVIYDASLNIAFDPAFQLKFGKFKSPIGLEMLQNDAVLLFPERSLATNLVPSRDVGVVAGGGWSKGAVTYSAGVVNGSADAAYANNVATDNGKDFVGRIFFRPFLADADSLLKGLGFGLGGSAGDHNKSSSLTSGYKTDSQQTFFTYRSTVTPYGTTWRVSPQANYYVGPLSLQTEYTASAVTALVGTSKIDVRNSAWQVGVGYVLTGEKASYDGIVPFSPFRPGSGGWGALEIAARVDRLKIDSDAFPLLSDPAASASGATAYGLGLNWYLSKTIRFDLDYVLTNFDRASGTTSTTNTLIGADERAILTRVQVGF